MFGVQVFVWNAQNKNAWFWQRLKQYLFDGEIGHCALKITVPSNPLVDDMIKRYCKNPQGKTIVPHFQTHTKLTGKSVDSASGKMRYFPRPVPSWDIYFSWWPDKLGLEHIDRRIENRVIGAIEYDPKWQDYLDIKYLPQIRGPIHHWLGSTLSRLFFGKPKLVAKGVEVIVHPHPQREQWLDKLTTSKANYEKLRKKYKHIRVEIVLARSEVNRLKAKLSESNYLVELIVSLVTDDKLYEQWRARKTKKLEDITKKLSKLEREAQQIDTMKEEQKEKLIVLENAYFSEVASMGLKPTESFSYPLQGYSHTRMGLHLEQMLKTMHGIVNNREPFHIFNHNCCSTVYDIVMAGVQGVFGEQIPDLPFYAVQTPDNICHFLQSLTTALLSFSLEEVKTQLPALDIILDVKEAEKPAIVIASPRKHANLAQNMSTRMSSKASLKLH